ncbi:hypothetical protein K438DRAFT_1905793 [Mycena galopus ATCC 62051]|nr:hypothetical protein K438DRAFT_1905793 [Mycena galopus ATCC 62051]
MSVKTYSWVSLWFLLTAPVRHYCWDVGYWGDLHWIWAPYSIYQNVYGLPALEHGDGFTNAQSLMNVIETIMNLVYLYTAHVTAWPAAPLIGFTAATLTLAKTVLYWAQEYYCNYCADLIQYWIIPNGCAYARMPRNMLTMVVGSLWLVIPSFIIWRLGKDLVADLNVAHAASVKAASGKTK